ncbi:MAG: ester cyclase [Acidobacteria bacterium]|nr:ester cyclase [Acidobacteriota bacterium]
MSEKNEAIVRRMFEEVWNNRQIDAIERYHTSDFAHRDPQNPAQGLDAFREVVKKYQSAFPDARLEIEDLLSAGDQVVVRWRATGTHRGMLEGLPATGRQAAVTGISIFCLSGDKIREEFVNWDTLGLMQQLGVVTLPGKAAAAGA